MTTMGDIELGGNEPADGVRALPPLTSRRMVLASGAALTIAGLVGGALVRRSEASDDDEDHSGPGGGGDDDDNSGPGGGGDDREDHHGLPPAESTQVAGITTVRIVDERFEPNNILIETGQTVTWLNLDDDQHTASGRGIDTGVINPGDQGQVTFLEPGEFNYTCNFHSEMLGRVTVTGESRGTPVASPEASPLAVAGRVEVAIVDFAFEPARVRVSVGGTVIWSNDGEAPHSIYATWAQSKILNTGDSYSRAFDTIGSYEYQCGLHPGMTGAIEVVDDGSASPEAIINSDPTGAWLVDYVWNDPGALPIGRVRIQLRPDGVNTAKAALERNASLVGRWTGRGWFECSPNGVTRRTWYFWPHLGPVDPNSTLDERIEQVRTVHDADIRMAERGEILPDGTYEGRVAAVLRIRSNGDRIFAKGRVAGIRQSG